MLILSKYTFSIIYDLCDLHTAWTISKAFPNFRPCKIDVNILDENEIFMYFITNKISPENLPRYRDNYNLYIDILKSIGFNQEEIIKFIICTCKYDWDFDILRVVRLFTSQIPSYKQLVALIRLYQIQKLSIYGKIYQKTYNNFIYKKLNIRNRLNDFYLREIISNPINIILYPTKNSCPTFIGEINNIVSEELLKTSFEMQLGIKIIRCSITYEDSLALQLYFPDKQEKKFRISLPDTFTENNIFELFAKLISLGYPVGWMTLDEELKINQLLEFRIRNRLIDWAHFVS